MSYLETKSDREAVMCVPLLLTFIHEQREEHSSINAARQIQRTLYENVLVECKEKVRPLNIVTVAAAAAAIAIRCATRSAIASKNIYIDDDDNKTVAVSRIDINTQPISTSRIYHCQLNYILE